MRVPKKNTTRRERNTGAAGEAEPQGGPPEAGEEPGRAHFPTVLGVLLAEAVFLRQACEGATCDLCSLCFTFRTTEQKLGS